MKHWTRRSFISSAIKGIPAATLVSAGCAPSKDEDLDAPEGTSTAQDTGSAAADDTGESFEDTGDGSDSGSTDVPPALADTGPELENRWPTSLTEAEQTDLDVNLHVLSGTLPSDMTGHAFTTYPHPMDDDSPQFIGDGMVVRLDFEPDRVGLFRQNVRTPCFYADQATRGTEYEFQPSGMARISLSLGSRNSLNTNFLVMDDRLFLAYDGGRPWEIDPVTLQPVTPVGAFDEWTSMVPSWIGWLRPWPFPVVLTCAHPVREPRTGEMYTINFGMNAAILAPFTRLIRWDGNGALQSWNLVDEEGNNVEIVQSAHQIAVTEDYIVFIDIALRMEWEDTLGLGTTRAQIPDATIWVARRTDIHAGNTNVVCKEIIVPRESTHFQVDYLNPDGKITLYISHNCATDPSEFLASDDINPLTHRPVRADMVGFFASGTDACALGRYVIDVESKAILDSDVLYDDECMMSTAALYTHKEMDVRDVYENVYWLSLGYSEELRLDRLEELYADYPYRRFDIADLPRETLPGVLFRVYQPTMEIEDKYAFPNGRLPISPQFVPREGSASDTDGYIVTWVCSDDTATESSSGDELWIFDAANLAQGPLARLGHPDLDIPFTLHTAWMPSIGPRTSTYQVPLRDDIGNAVSRLNAELRVMFETEVYPYFD